MMTREQKAARRERLAKARLRCNNKRLWGEVSYLEDQVAQWERDYGKKHAMHEALTAHVGIAELKLENALDAMDVVLSHLRPAIIRDVGQAALDAYVEANPQ